MYRTRILGEAVEASKLKDETIILQFEEKDLSQWKAYLFGPEDSPY